MSIRYTLGINTCFAVKRWPRPSDWARVVREEFGLDVVQHSFDLVDLNVPTAELEAQAADVQQACADYGLRIHSTFTGLAAYSANLLLDPDARVRARALEWYRRAIAFTAMLGASSTGGHVGALSVGDWNDSVRRAERWQELIASLAILAADARTAGLSSLMVENLAAAREPSTMALVDSLLTAGDEERVAVSLCLDVGHQCVPGTSGADRDPYAWLERYGATAVVVQLQQSDADGDHHWPFTPTTNAAGRIEGARVLAALERSSAADVVLVLEVIPAFETDDAIALDELRQSVEYWRNALAGSS